MATRISLAHPVPGSWPTDRFGPRPAFGDFHNGQDYAAPAGTPIRATHNGVVDYAGWQQRGWEGAGYMVRLRGNGFYTQYLHMQSEPVIAAGETVSTGDIIGYVGSTGNSTGPHLHFMLMFGLRGVDAVDPVPYITNPANEPKPVPNPKPRPKDEPVSKHIAIAIDQAITRTSPVAKNHLVIVHGDGSGIYTEAIGVGLAYCSALVDQYKAGKSAVMTSRQWEAYKMQLDQVRNK